MNNDLISRSALNEVMWDESHDIVLHNEYGKDEACIGLTYNEIENIIDNAPTVELDESVIQEVLNKRCMTVVANEYLVALHGKRPQGEWIEVTQRISDSETSTHWECSICREPDRKDGKSKFCCECGADMRGENTDS